MNYAKNKKSLIAALCSLVIVSSLMTYWYVWSTKFVSTDNAYIETHLYPVTARMMGYVREVSVEESNSVKKNDILLKLDDIDVKLEIGFKEAKMHKVESDTKRAEILKHEKALSDSDLEMAEAALFGAKTDLEGSHLKMQFTEVHSPVDGTIAKRSAQPGQFVQPGQTLFVIVPNDKAWIKANFKESQIRLIKKGQKVKIKVDAYPGENWDGEVDYIFPSSVASLSLIPPESSTGSFTKVVQRFPVRITFNKKEKFPLLPGMSVVPTVIVNE